MVFAKTTIELQQTRTPGVNDPMSSVFTSPIFGFNFNDQFDLQAIVAAHNEARRSAILMLSANAIAFSKLPYLLKLVQAAQDESQIRFYLQLDHGRDLESIKECINSGFDLVMADFSREGFESNILKTREVVELAHKAGVLVEGELGIIPTQNSNHEFDEQCLTRPSAAVEFVEQTGVDLLAVSVGNAHGDDRRKPSLKIMLIEEIKRQVRVPLVLHGADFYPNAVLRECFQAGIIKANIGPELRQSYVEALRKGIQNGGPDHRPALVSARNAVKLAVSKRLEALDA